MEFVDSPWNSGNSASVQKLPNEQTNVNNACTEKDKFQCTFFRQPKHRFLTKLRSFLPISESWASFDLSDTCTESESEFDEQVNATPVSRTNSSSLYTIDDQIPPTRRKTPRVTFARTSYIHPERTARSSPEDRSTKRGGKNGFTKVVQLPKKKDYLRQRNDLRNNKQGVKFCKTRFHRCPETQRSPKDEISLEECKRNEDTCEHSGILREGKVTNTIWQDGGAMKRRKLIEHRIVRNKRLLKSMEEVIRELSEQEAPRQTRFDSVQSIRPRNKAGETDLAKAREEQSQDPEKIANSRTDEDAEVKKPIFKKPGVEKMLNDSMHKAVLKYRTSGNTWNAIIKGESSGT